MAYLHTNTLVLGLILFIAGGLHLFAQEFEGTVRDSINGEPVPFATLQIGSGGVITNEEGYFRFRVEPSRVDSITVSCLGYRKKVIPLEQLTGKGHAILLSEAVVHLNEVFLTNRTPDPSEILARVRARIAVNYRPDNKEHRIFSRQTESVDFEELDFQLLRASGVEKDAMHQTNRELDSLAGSVLRSKSVHFRDYLGSMFLKDPKEAKLRVEKATSLLDTEKNFSVEEVQNKAQAIVLQYLDSTQSYRLKSGLFKLEDSLSLKEEFSEKKEARTYSADALRKRASQLLNSTRFTEESLLMELLEPGNYEFRFTRATFLNEELIYILDYSPRRGRGRSKYRGKLFVNGNDYAIVKLTYAYAEGRRGDKLNLKWLAGIKFLEDMHSGTILFRKGPLGSYDPSYIQETNGSYFYVSRPVKFIENSKDKDKVRFDILLSGRNRVREELLITYTAELDQAGFEAIEEPEKIPVIELKRYDATLWQDAETIQPLEEMRQFNAL